MQAREYLQECEYMILTEKEARIESKKDLQRVGIDLREVSFCVEREKILDD